MMVLCVVFFSFFWTIESFLTLINLLCLLAGMKEFIELNSVVTLFNFTNKLLLLSYCSYHP